MTEIVPMFNPDDCMTRSIFPTKIVNGERTIGVWLLWNPVGSAGWKPEVVHREGPWPLLPNERFALEDWIEKFGVGKGIPGDKQCFPPDYRHQSGG